MIEKMPRSLNYSSQKVSLSLIYEMSGVLGRELGDVFNEAVFDLRRHFSVFLYQILRFTWRDNQ